MHLTYSCLVYGIAALSFLGIVGLMSGAAVFYLKPYDSIFQWKVTFSEGGEIFELWRQPPVDLFLRVYLWNVTNSAAFLEGRDDKLRIQEVGPYVYREVFSHSNATFNANATLTAIPLHPLEWVPELSEGRAEDDLLILPNIALLSAAHVVTGMDSYWARLALNMLIRQTNSQPLVEMTAKEFMFGYESKLLTLGNTFIPKWITFDKLGLIDRMYDFDGDYETIFTGEQDYRTAGLIDTYRGSRQLPQWQGECANVFMASDGVKFAGDADKEATHLFYRKSMCRAQTLVKVGETTRQNLEGYVYRYRNDSLDNGKENPANKCFCRDGKCLQAGLVDVTECYYGFPIALSHPHFLHAEPALLEEVEGSRPDPDLHESYFIIQPKSGLPLDLSAKFQINMALNGLRMVAHTERFANMVLPLLWAEIRLYSLSDSLANRFRIYLNVLPLVERGSMWALGVGGAGLLLASLWKFAGRQKAMQRRLHRRTRQAWIDEEMANGNANGDKLATLIRVEKRQSMSAKELDLYFSGLVAPPDQDLEV